MSYQDEYYKRTPEQKHAIYKDRERTWNVIRFFVLLFPFLGAMVLIDHWLRNIVEPVVSNVTAPASDQAVISLDVSCLFLPALFGVLFLGAVMLRAIGRSSRDVRESKPKRGAQPPTPSQSDAIPAARMGKPARKAVASQEASTWVDEYIAEMNECKTRRHKSEEQQRKKHADARAKEELIRQKKADEVMRRAQEAMEKDTWTWDS